MEKTDEPLKEGSEVGYYDEGWHFGILVSLEGTTAKIKVWKKTVKVPFEDLKK